MADMNWPATSLAVEVAPLAVVIWDIFDYIPLDYLMLRRSPLRAPTIVYLLSRLSTLGYLLTTVIFVSWPGVIGLPCSVGVQARLSLFVAAQGFTTFLFFLRVRAVYGRSFLPTAIFFVLWGLCVVGTSLIAPVLQTIRNNQIVAMGIVPTSSGYYDCSPALGPGLTIAPVVAPLLYDTAVFFAIAWKLAQCPMTDVPPNPVGRVRIAFSSSSLPAIARALLRDGQFYYLVSTVVNIASFIVLLVEPDSLSFRGFAGDPCLAVIHICACRVFRNTKLGLMSSNSRTTNNLGRFELDGLGSRRGDVVSTLAFASSGQWTDAETGRFNMTAGLQADSLKDDLTLGLKS